MDKDQLIADIKKKINDLESHIQTIQSGYRNGYEIAISNYYIALATLTK